MGTAIVVALVMGFLFDLPAPYLVLGAVGAAVIFMLTGS